MNMNSRELNALAAEAAGIEVVAERKPTQLRTKQGVLWDPLNYASQAFELMTRLRMDVCVQAKQNEVFVAALAAGGVLIEHEEDWVADDADAAARLAITALAAKIAMHNKGANE